LYGRGPHNRTTIKSTYAEHYEKGDLNSYVVSWIYIR
jgi:hypothetical protein